MSLNVPQNSGPVVESIPTLRRVSRMLRQASPAGEGRVVIVMHTLGALSSVQAVMLTRTPQGAIAWAVSLNTFPYLAVPAYWIFGQSRFDGYEILRHREMLADDSLERETIRALREQGMLFEPQTARQENQQQLLKRLAPENPDHQLVYLTSFSYLEETDKVDIQTYRYEPGFMHQKVILIDDDVACVGTVKFDNRSLRLLTAATSEPRRERLDSTT